MFLSRIPQQNLHPTDPIQQSSGSAFFDCTHPFSWPGTDADGGRKVPENRLMKRVTIDDAMMADRMTELLMGSDVEPRREFIHEHAQEAVLDI